MSEASTSVQTRGISSRDGWRSFFPLFVRCTQLWGQSCSVWWQDAPGAAEGGSEAASRFPVCVVVLGACLQKLCEPWGWGDDGHVGPCPASCASVEGRGDYSCSCESCQKLAGSRERGCFEPWPQGALCTSSGGKPQHSFLWAGFSSLASQKIPLYSSSSS